MQVRNKIGGNKQMAHSGNSNYLKQATSTQGTSVLRNRPFNSLQRRELMENTNFSNQTLKKLSKSSIQRKILYYRDRSELTWEDFKVKNQVNKAYDAETLSGIKVKWPSKNASSLIISSESLGNSCIKGKNNTSEYKVTVGLTQSDLTVLAYMDTLQSWVKKGKESDELLSHEQGHFDIAGVFAEKLLLDLQNLVADTSVSLTGCGEKDTKKTALESWHNLEVTKQIKGVVDQRLEELNSTQDIYDEDPEHGTNHGVNAENQKKWRSEILKGLPNY